ncbi:MAG: ribbon-helix-helix domain-containing protein [Bosea sp. (in: a-proteobacteria)]
MASHPGHSRPAADGRVREGSGVVKRSLSIAGHATSISLEEPFWAELKAISAMRGMSLASLVAEIDGNRGRTNLSSALRVHVLKTVQARSTETARHPPD